MSTNLVADLRDLADFLEQNPDLPRPKKATLCVLTFEEPESLELASRIAKQLKTFDKAEKNALLTLSRRFGRLSLAYTFWREAICTKRVIGTKAETVLVPPEDTVMVEELKTTEIVEWDCPSLLRGTKQ